MPDTPIGEGRTWGPRGQPLGSKRCRFGLLRRKQPGQERRSRVWVFVMAAASAVDRGKLARQCASGATERVHGPPREWPDDHDVVVEASFTPAGRPASAQVARN